MLNSAKGHTMKEQLQAKIDEFVALLAQATCEDTHILLDKDNLQDTDEDEAALEFAGQVRTLRDMVEYYVD